SQTNGRKKMPKLAGVLLFTTVCGFHAAYAEEATEETGPFASQNFTSTVYLTTDYRFRGISNTDGPAIQGSIDWTYSGFYLGVWASNTELSDANIEIDYYGGYRYTWSGITFDVTGLYYHYPGEDENDFDEFDPFAGQEIDYAEAHVGASYTFDLDFSPSVAAHYYWSPDFLFEDGTGHYVQGNVGVTVPMGFSSTGLGVYGIVGYQDVEGDKSSGALGVTTTCGGKPAPTSPSRALSSIFPISTWKNPLRSRRSILPPN
ncbi:MAG: TorF family putative porin, partial [bacterium]